MANLKEIKRRIGTVKKTKQITSAMKLVAGAKLARATAAATGAKPYQEQLAGVLSRVAAYADGGEEPLLSSKPEVKKILVAVLTSDRGLCGGFNNTLLRRTMDWLEQQDARGATYDIVVYGRKGKAFLAYRKVAVADEVLNYGKQDKMELVRDLSDRMVSGFVSEDGYDEVYLVFNSFVNVLTQKPTFKRVLPLVIEAGEEDSSAGDLGEMEFEPDATTLLGRLLPLFLRTLVLQAFLETEAGEQAARMTAMDNATRNAGDLVDALTLEYNRARQAAITKELIEIVSGAEAL